MTTTDAAWAAGAPIYSGVATRRVVRPVLINSAICLIILSALIRVGVELNLLGTPRHLTLPTAQLVAVRKIPRPTSPPSPTSAASQLGAITPSCTPDSGYKAPGNLPIAGISGLMEQVDPTHYYQIYGDTSDQVRQQIIACAPRLGGKDDYTGYAVYNLSWSYGYAVVDQNSCRLNGVAVGMRIGEVLPAWRPGALASAAFTNDWNQFMTALDSHEQGHMEIDKQYGGKIFSDLQALPAEDCKSLGQQAAAVIKSDVAELNAANDSYDALTDHGATQGAILP